VKILKKGNEIYGKFAGEKLMEDINKIQWVSQEFIKIRIFIPSLPFKNGEFDENSLKIIEGYAEKNVEEIKHGEIVQFERVGFVKIERKNGIVGILAHR